MQALTDLMLEGRPVQHHRPWQRATVDPKVWASATLALADGHWTLLGLWGETNTGHMALLEEPTGTIGVITLEGLEGGYPSVAQYHLPALRPERAIHDLVGLVPQALPDPRPWLDHGRWGLRFPLGGCLPPAPETAP